MPTGPPVTNVSQGQNLWEMPWRRADTLASGLDTHVPRRLRQGRCICSKGSG